ncbi:MAG: lysylphosphatidylglycerol synthase transmembrane domain-containing protein [Candidatus Limnocylindrales bacterium]
MTRWLRRPIVWLPITLALLGLVAWRTRPWEAGRLLARLDAAPLFVAVALNAVLVVLWAVRSADLLGAAGRSVPVRPLIPMTALANTINGLTPGSVGELLRLYLLREHHGVDYSTGAAVVLIERVVAFGYLAGSAAIAWATHLAGLPGAVAVLGFILLAILPAIVYKLGIRPSALVTALPLGLVIGRERWGRTAGNLGRIDTTIGGLLTHPVRAVVFAGTTTLILVTYTLQLCLISGAAGVSLAPLVAWGALGLSITVGVLSFLPFGLGATDLVLATLLSSLGIDPPVAAGVVLGYRLTTTAPLALVGSLSYGYLSATLPAGGPADAMRQASRALDASGSDGTP